MNAGYLVDTHVLLWALHRNPKLRTRHAEILRDDTSEVMVSIATLWEIAIKSSIGKLQTVEDLPCACERAGYDLLAIATSNNEAIRTLPHHHRDPFDRMLIAQARLEDLTILTVDPAFSAYDVAVI